MLQWQIFLNLSVLIQKQELLLELTIPSNRTTHSTLQSLIGSLVFQPHWPSPPYLLGLLLCPDRIQLERIPVKSPQQKEPSIPSENHSCLTPGAYRINPIKACKKKRRVLNISSLISQARVCFLVAHFCWSLLDAEFHQHPFPMQQRFLPLLRSFFFF